MDWSKEYAKHLRHSPYPVRDAIYNALVKAHAKRGKPWTTEGFFSDRVFWTNVLDQLWPWVPNLLFIYAMYLVAGYTYDHYGLFKGVVAVAIIVLVRVNALVRQVTFTNAILKKGKEEE